MSKWGQDAERISALREKRESDLERWSTLDNHNEGWINRAKLAVTSIRPNSKVVELGAGRAFLRDLLPEGCSYTPVDLVAHEPDFLVVDLNSDSWTLPISDVVVALGTFEYVYDFADVLSKLRTLTKRVILTYCCKVEHTDSELRMRQGWLTDFTKSQVTELIAAAGFAVSRNVDLQKEVHFTQSMWFLEKIEL